MMRQLIANLWLLGLTLLLCSIVYPLVLLGLAHLPFLRERAEGSLLVDAKGNVIGSRLQAQAFDDDKYFWPRPSAASYKADGSSGGGSNWAASNPALRQRVEFQTLGALLKYGPSAAKAGQLIGPDIETWFAAKVGVVALWAKTYPAVAEAWVKDNKLVVEFIDNEKSRSLKTHVDSWLIKINKKIDKVSADELAVPFLTWFSEKYPASWPTVQQIEVTNNKTGQEGKMLIPKSVKDGKEIRNLFYPLWREEHANVDLESVPGDLVTASGSGLDPHITLKGALYQFGRVADEWVKLRPELSAQEIKRRLHKLLEAHAHAPLGGLAGVDLVNVVEVNFALQKGDW